MAEPDQSYMIVANPFTMPVLLRTLVRPGTKAPAWF